MNNLLIYGATGYTGSMVARQAKQAGLSFSIAGRDPEKLAALATELGVPYRAFTLGDATVVAEQLRGFSAVLNCAGPFVRSAEALIRASMAAQVHYLDITAEINVYRMAERFSASAAEAGIMVMPGVGWDVVTTDCLAVHVARRVKEPVALRIALQVAGSMSRGSAVSAGEIVAAGLLTRVDGALISSSSMACAQFDFGDGPVACAPLSFGDLVTAWHSTGIPNIAMFVNVTGDAFPGGDLSKLPDGPTQAERDSQGARAVAEVTSADGTIARSMIETINGYSYTPLAAIETARRVLRGEVNVGFDTPARVFGSAHAQRIPGTRIIDL
ncbi:saccharopine dehydrogenase NADP-binding domain-containing protein [Alcaligenaceae bacterium A4P071]|nr:saccharopine dehydrogenase NADP-binding domain-containing protein [Alcaligenaceae bacterium A4P071]